MEGTLAENCPLPLAISYVAIGGCEFLSENLHVAIGPARVLDAWAHPGVESACARGGMQREARKGCAQRLVVAERCRWQRR